MEPLYFENFDLDNVVSPVKVDVLQELLEQSNYDAEKTQFLVEGFKNGFSLGYEGDENVQILSNNLKLTVGNETILWNKVMKEVKEKRFAGPFAEIPFDNFIQSPIRLVPKDGGKDVRLIFHLSHPRNVRKNQKSSSVNANTPAELCSVKYPSFDDAIRLCMKTRAKYGAKSDMKSAFRNLGILKKHWKYLLLKARSPFDGKIYFFVDKCLPFGSSISCSHFQDFSDAVAHIFRYMSKEDVINYLDDYFFAAFYKWMCNQQVNTFLDICERINFPVSMEKTVWASHRIIFLGILIDLLLKIVAIPKEKIKKAKELISAALDSKNKKVTLLHLQRICGMLNFLGKCIVPGRAFTRRLDAQLEGKVSQLKPHHHLKSER